MKAGHKRLVYVYSIENINIAIKKTIDMKKYILINCDCDKNIGTANDSTIFTVRKIYSKSCIRSITYCTYMTIFFS